jgi:hypothetical protein
MTTDEARRRNLRRGTAVRQARARLKRAIAAGEVTGPQLFRAATPAGTNAAVIGHEILQRTADKMPLEALLKAAGADPIDVLMRADALELRGYITETLTTERREQIAAALQETPEP